MTPDQCRHTRLSLGILLALILVCALGEALCNTLFPLPH